MIKKLFSTVLLSLLCGGLLFSGGVDAMQYVVYISGEGSDKTSISIPESTASSATIKWCENCAFIDFYDESCESKEIQGVNHRVCSRNYGAPGEYIVTFSGSNQEFDNLYLNDANIKSITNFDGIKKIANLYLNKNNNILLNQNSFNNADIYTVYLDENKLSTFNVISNNTEIKNKISLTNNLFTGIVDNIWNNRNNYNIKLSNTTTYPTNKDKTIDLSNNNIKFVGITRVGSEDTIYCDMSDCLSDYKYSFSNVTSYEFQQFGYNYQNNHLGNYYRVNQGNKIISRGNGGDENLANITVNGPLKPGDYTYITCIENEDYCDSPDPFIKDSVNFNVSYDVDIEFTNTPGDTITNPSSISFNRQKFGPYPDDFLSGYRYELRKGSTKIDSDSGITPNESYQLSSDLEDGEYTFKVYLLDGSGNVVRGYKDDNYYSYYNNCGNDNKCYTSYGNNEDNTDVFAEVTFSVNTTPDQQDQSGNKVEINHPNDGKITSQPYTFSWIPTITSDFKIDTYEYKLMQGSTQITGGNKDIKSFSQNGLANGEYELTVTMHYHQENHPAYVGLTSDTKKFTVDVRDASLEITSPTPGQELKSISHTFTRSGNPGSAHNITKYHYEIKKGSIPITSGNITNPNTQSFPYSGLTNGNDYTITVDMYDGSTKIATDTKNFKVKKEATGATLNITNPSTDNQKLESLSGTFTRNGTPGTNYELSGYTYSVKEAGTNGATITGGSTKTNTSFTLNNLEHGKAYIFTVNMHAKEDNSIIKTEPRTFSVALKNTTYLTITSPTGTGTSKTGTFSRNGDADPNYHTFGSYHYTLTSDKGYNYSGDSTKKSDSFNLSDLVSGKYTFNVKMLSSTGAVITGATRIFDVKIPQTLTITNPSSGASLSSSSTTFNWSVYNDTIANPVYSYTLSGPTTYTGTTTATSLSYNGLKNGNYTLNVKMLGGNDTVAQDTVSFSVSIKSSGGGGGSSGGGRRTNNLSIKINDSNPTTNQRVGATITIDDNYRGKVTFTKIQYRDSSADKWVDAPLTSSNYVSDYSDDAKLGYYNITSSDNGKKVLSDFLKFKKNGNYRIYVEDKDGYTDYVQFYIGNGKVEPVPTPASDEERYIARSCKKYKLTYNNSLNVRTSPNLKKNEYFVTTDYFKRYIDSKNAQIDGCPTNDPRISTTYKDTTNRDDKYTAPNGKVYFINNKNGKYQSDELDYPSMLFSTLSEIKYYIRDRNPFINMAWTK